MAQLSDSVADPVKASVPPLPPSALATLPRATSMVAAGKSGLRWNEEDFVVYVRDATTYLRNYLDDPDARGKMAYQLRDVQKAYDVWAYLESVTRP